MHILAFHLVLFLAEDRSEGARDLLRCRAEIDFLSASLLVEQLPRSQHPIEHQLNELTAWRAERYVG